MPNSVFDSYAVLAFLFGEPGAGQVEGLLNAAATSGQRVLICSVNWAEVLYMSRRKREEKGLAGARGFARTMPVELIPADQTLAEAAAEFKAAHKLSLADAFAAALAAQRGAELVTGDPEFKPLDGTISLRWLP
ncbi:MAG TPA: PIN domain-containing protein [Planctomycetota bacterium]|nr:PIN domain-containing protein [Planctomycetota bacterium]